MDVKDLVKKIYSFEGEPHEWLEFEKEVRREIEHLSKEDEEYLVQSEAMESLLMACDGIRWEMEKGNVDAQDLKYE